MAIGWESIIPMIWDVVKTTARKVWNWIRREKSHSGQSVPKGPQVQVLTINRGLIVNLKVPLSSDVRDVLHISRNTPLDRISPRLILPGEGLIKSADFVNIALDENLDRVDKATECVDCHKLRRWGTTLNGRWVCEQCYRKLIRQMTKRDGEFALSDRIVELATDQRFGRHVTDDPRIAKLLDDDMIAALIDLSRQG